MKRKDFKLINEKNFLNFEISPKDKNINFFRLENKKVLFKDNKDKILEVKKKEEPLIWNYYKMKMNK